jgi:hypothetical protein
LKKPITKRELVEWLKVEDLSSNSITGKKKKTTNPNKGDFSFKNFRLAFV